MAARTISPRRLADCLFCGIISKAKDNPLVLAQNDYAVAFLDIHPLSRGHALVVPVDHGAKLHDVEDEYLREVMPLVKKVVKATGATDYNILQNNGTIAHQQVHHVHFHIIPKPNATEGLGISWPADPGPDMDKLKDLAATIKSKLEDMGKEEPQAKH